MEIRVGGPGQEAEAVAVTMRTPGGDFELAVGFLFTEGLIARRRRERVAYCDDVEDEEQRYNVVTVTLDRALRRRAASAELLRDVICGVCGKASLDDIGVRCDAGRAPGLRSSADVLVELPERCGAHSGCSTGPAGCTRPGSSRRGEAGQPSARTSGATTRSTR